MMELGSSTMNRKHMNNIPYAENINVESSRAAHLLTGKGINNNNNNSNNNNNNSSNIISNTNNHLSNLRGESSDGSAGNIDLKIKKNYNISNLINTNNSNNNGEVDVRYKECLKNHAANKGGYALDGCGEFMPSGDEGSLEALKCAACGCHRNFHRRQINGGANNGMGALLALPTISGSNNNNNDYVDGDHHHHNNNIDSGEGFLRPSLHYNANRGHHMGFLPHLHHHHHHQYMHSLMGPSKLIQGQQYGASNTHGGKRFRTKFTMEQREKMFEFSEKLGWRIQKQDEADVQQFCAEAGVKRHVLKVWMHNNKNTFGKKLLRFPEAFNALPESSS